MKTLTCTLLLLTVPVTVVAQCQPERMVRIVVRDDSPSIPKGHFAGQPKVIYRLGSKFARVEEQPDAAQRIHGLAVVNEPDAWMANLALKTGQHAVDTEPGGRTVFPLFTRSGRAQSFPSEFEKLEFGCEVAFFDGFKSPITEFNGPDGKMTKQAFGIGEWMLVLLRASPADPPSIVFLHDGGGVVAVLRYLEYRSFEQPDMTLFEKPQGIVFAE